MGLLGTLGSALGFGGGAGKPRAPRVKGARATAQPSALGSALRKLLAAFQRQKQWAPLVYYLVGASPPYALVLLGTLSCMCAGGALVGAATAFGALVVVGSAAFLMNADPQLKFLALGSLLSLLPAALLGAGVALHAEYSSATVDDGPGGAGLDASALAASVAAGADVWGLVRAEVRTDMLATAHRDLPRRRADGTQNAGKEESGTYCAMPVVAEGWQPGPDAAPVAMFAICDNDWRGHVDCVAASSHNYSAADYYGYRVLDECINGIVRHYRWQARDYPGGTGRPPDYFFRSDLGQLEKKEDILAGVVAEAAALLGVSQVEPPGGGGAPAVRFEGTTACCGSQAAEVLTTPVLYSLGSLAVPLGIAGWILYTRHVKPRIKPSIITRKSLLKRVRGSSA